MPHAPCCTLLALLPIAYCLVFEPLIRKIHQVHLVRCPGQCRIKPPEIIYCRLLPAEPALVNKDSLPLSSLGFMAGHSICKFDLQSIVVRVVTDSLKLFAFRFYAGIICQYCKVQLLGFFS